MDNDSVTAPSGAPALNPQRSRGKLGNLITIAAVGAISGFLAAGVGYKFENSPTNRATAGSGSLNTVNESQIVVATMAYETVPGGFNNPSASGYDIVSGWTKNGSLVIQSGSFLLGRDGAPNITLSGGSVMIGAGLWKGSAVKLEVRGTMSGAKVGLKPTTGTAALSAYGNAKGAHLCLWDTDGAGWTVLEALNGTFTTSHIASAGECP